MPWAASVTLHQNMPLYRQNESNDSIPFESPQVVITNEIVKRMP